MVPVVHNATVTPPAGAAAFNVTVPVAEPPVAGFEDFTLAGLTETADSNTLTEGVIARVAVVLVLL